jgi:hypothetical protein
MPTITSEAEKIATQLGEEYSDLDIKSTFDDWVIEVLSDILAEETWPFGNVLSSFTTTASSENYTIDAGTGEVKALYRTDVDLWLSYVPLEQLRASQLDYDSENPPRYWTFSSITGSQPVVKLWPIPDAAYEIYVYGADEVDFNSITTTSAIPLPNPMISLLRTGVRQLFYEHAGNDSAAARESIKFKEKLMTARGRYLQTRALRLHFGFSDIPNTDDSMGRPVMPTSIPVVPIV